MDFKSFFNPLTNKTPKEIAGTVISILTALAAAVAAFQSALGGN